MNASRSVSYDDMKTRTRPTCTHAGTHTNTHTKSMTTQRRHMLVALCVLSGRLRLVPFLRSLRGDYVASAMCTHVMCIYARARVYKTSAGERASVCVRSTSLNMLARIASGIRRANDLLCCEAIFFDDFFEKSCHWRI